MIDGYFRDLDCSRPYRTLGISRESELIAKSISAVGNGGPITTNCNILYDRINCSFFFQPW